MPDTCHARLNFGEHPVLAWLLTSFRHACYTRAPASACPWRRCFLLLTIRAWQAGELPGSSYPGVVRPHKANGSNLVLHALLITVSLPRIRWSLMLCRP